jgi:hypothetical protein
VGFRGPCSLISSGDFSRAGSGCTGRGSHGVRDLRSGLQFCWALAGLAVGPRQGIFLWRGLAARAAAPTLLGRAGGVTTSGVSCAHMQRGMSTWEHCAPGAFYSNAPPRTGGVGSLL